MTTPYTEGMTRGTPWVGTGCDGRSGPPLPVASWSPGPRHQGTWGKVGPSSCLKGEQRSVSSRSTHPCPRFVEPCSTANALMTEKIVVGMVDRIVLSGLEGTSATDIFE